MGEFILINALLFGGSYISNDGYIELALGYHPTIDLPEASFDNSIVQWEVGIKKKRWRFFYQHTSGLYTAEEGAGLNIFGIKYKIK